MNLRSMWHWPQLLAVLLGAVVGGAGRYFSEQGPMASPLSAETGLRPDAGTSTSTRSAPTLAAILASEGLEASTQCLRWLETATAADCAAAASTLTRKLTKWEWSDHRRWIFYTRWAELDPPAALAFCLEQGHEEFTVILQTWSQHDYPQAWAAAMAVQQKDRSHACLAALQGLAMVDPRRAWAEAMAQEALLGKDWDRQPLLMALAKVDPSTAMALLRPEDEDENASGRIWGLWATRDLPAAWAAACALPNDSQRLWGGKNVLEHLIEHSPTAARNFLDSFPANAMGYWKGVLAHRLAYGDPAGVRAWAESLPAGPARQHVLGGLATALASSGQPEDALPVFASMGWDFTDQSFYTGREATTDAAGAMSEESDYNRSMALENAITECLAAWGRQDPTAALQTCSKIQGGDHTPSAAGCRISKEWAQRDPSTALAAMAALPEDNSNMRENLLGSVMQQWVRQDLTAAKDALETLPPGNLRKSAAMPVVDAMLGIDPAAALEWCFQHEMSRYGFAKVLETEPELALAQFDSPALTGPKRQELTDQLAEHHLYEREPALAVAFLAKENITDSMFERSMDSYLRQSPTAASTWARALPDGVAKQTSVGRLVHFLLKQTQPDFDAALLWAQSMQASPQRDAALLETLSQWQHQQPNAAQQALDSFRLSAPESARLLEQLHHPPTPKATAKDPFAP